MHVLMELHSSSKSPAWDSHVQAGNNDFSGEKRTAHGQYSTLNGLRGIQEIIIFFKTIIIKGDSDLQIKTQFTKFRIDSFILGLSFQVMMENPVGKISHRLLYPEFHFIVSEVGLLYCLCVILFIDALRFEFLFLIQSMRKCRGNLLCLLVIFYKCIINVCPLAYRISNIYIYI